MYRLGVPRVGNLSRHERAYMCPTDKRRLGGSLERVEGLEVRN